MIVDSGHDIFVFASTFLCGQIICVIFDAFRAIRKNISPSVHIVNLHDILFWAVAFYLVYNTFRSTNNANIRLYEVLSLICSCSSYYLFESRHILKVLTVFFSWIIRPVQIIKGKIYILINHVGMCFSGVIRVKIIGFREKYIKKMRKSEKKEE